MLTICEEHKIYNNYTLYIQKKFHDGVSYENK